MDKDRNLKLLEKYKGFFVDFTAGKVMNPKVFTLKGDNTIREAQTMMREKKISGVPIVDDNGKLVNLVTLEDIIRALEKNELDNRIGNFPGKKIIALNVEDNFEKVIYYLERYSFGRYPVVDENNNLVGIITKQDILFTVISQLSLLYLHDERRREVLESDRSILLKEEKNDEEDTFVYNINLTDVNNAGEGSAKLKKFLKEKGYNAKLIRNISIATYEAEVNVVIHGGGIGKITAHTGKESIEIFIEDSGPGIESIEKALTPGFSTATDKIRGLGFGAGMGLPNIKRFANKLVLTSEKEKGVKLEMQFWIE